MRKGSHAGLGECSKTAAIGFKEFPFKFMTYKQ